MSTVPMGNEEFKPAPVDMAARSIGLRETTLLALGASYAALMFNLPEVAVSLGWLSVLLVLIALVRGPRPSPTLLFVYGLGLLLMTFWWPQEHWWQGAIALLWIGIALMVAGGAVKVATRTKQKADDDHPL